MEAELEIWGLTC